MYWAMEAKCIVYVISKINTTTILLSINFIKQNVKTEILQSIYILYSKTTPTMHIESIFNK